MTVTKTYCDHCGKEIDALSGYINDAIMISGERIFRDLCTDCADDLIKFIVEYYINATTMKGA